MKNDKFTIVSVSEEEIEALPKDLKRTGKANQSSKTIRENAILDALKNNDIRGENVTDYQFFLAKVFKEVPPKKDEDLKRYKSRVENSVRSLTKEGKIESVARGLFRLPSNTKGKKSA